MRSHLLLSLSVLFLTACGVSPQQKADEASVQESRVSPAIYGKMVRDEKLSVSDIESLSRTGVKSDVILRYLRNGDAVYDLSDGDVKSLREAGVSPSVIDYMLHTAAAARSDLYGPYTQDPFYPSFGPGGGGGPGR